MKKLLFVVYPNPARGLLRFSRELGSCELINVYGQTVVEQTEPSLVLPTDSIIPGVYYLRSGSIVRIVVIES